MTNISTSTRLARLLLPFALAAVANADVLILEQPELGAFKDPQLAVDLAPDGSTLIFAQEDIGGFTITGKSLTLVGPGSDLLELGGSVEIRDLAAGQSVRLHGMTVNARLEFSSLVNREALLIRDSAGSVRLSDCVFLGDNGSEFCDNGSPGILIQDCDDVAVLSSEAQGGTGGYCTQSGDGGAGIEVTQSVLAIYDSSIVGGNGGDSNFDGGDAASALLTTQTRLFASGTEFRGGNGGDAEDVVFECCGGDGGNGVDAFGLPRPRLLDCAYVAGNGGGSYWGTPGTSGQLRVWDLGTLLPLPGANRGLQVETNVLRSDGMLTVTLEGLAGDRFFLGASLTDGRSQPLGPAGVRFLPSPVLLTTMPQATLAVDGSTQIQIPAPSTGLPSHATWILQAIVKDAQGMTFFSGAALVTSLRPDGGPDCDANATWDVIDVVTTPAPFDCDGNLALDICETLPDCNGNGIGDHIDIDCMGVPDINGNGIPDSCDLGAPIYVDANAATGGDGSFGAPFSNLSDAVAASAFGEEIMLFNGVYSGPNNRGLVTGGLGLTFTGLGGAQNCTIDLEGADRFLAGSQSTLLVTLRGLRIINGSAQTGGAVVSDNQALLVEDCIFTDNEAANRGGALSTNAPITVRNSQFLRNKTLDNPTAPQPTGGAIRAQQDAVITDCVFDFNESFNGGAVGIILNFSLSGNAPTISHCVFRSNTARNGGGAMHAFGSILQFTTEQTFVVDNCFFGFNSAETAGGAFFFDKPTGSSDTARVRLSQCTLVDNSVVQGNGPMAGGGALFVGRSSDLELFSCIVWGNSSTLGAQVRVAGDAQRAAMLTVRSSAVQGGGGGFDIVFGNADFDTSNITSDPLFMGPPADFRLGAGSPCIDTVDASLLSQDFGDINGNGNTLEEVPFDLLGLPRRVDDPTVPDVGGSTAPVSDMGCFERQI